MFSIRSSESGNELIFDDLKGDNFTVCFKSFELSVKHEVWAYTDAHGLSNLFKRLAEYELPWSSTEVWKSIEGEFSLHATCNSRGVVNFKLCISNSGNTEPWHFSGNICTEIGQLPSIAKAAQQFFGVSVG